MGLVVLSVVLLSIVYQDFKDREVYFFLYPILFLAVGYEYYSLGFDVAFNLIAFNLLLVFFMVGLVFLYYYLKKHSLKSFFENVFGLGDLLFFVFLALFFSPANFLLVFNCSLILGLLLSRVFKSFKSRGVPLAGVQAIVVLFWIIGMHFNVLPQNFDDH